ncbi:MAG: PAS domain S-box protein [bacterium]
MKTADICIPREMIDKWQGIVDLIAEIVQVPAALIMKVEPPEITVFVSSQSEGNPYEHGEKASLNTGLYCETVMKIRRRLLVANALNEDEWKSNPDIKLGMISYLGFPIAWPNGDIFGTICVLDDKENTYNEFHQRLLLQIREVIEADLKYQFNLGIRFEKEKQMKKKLKCSSDESRRLMEQADRSRRALLSILEDEKPTEEALRENEEKYRTILENIEDGYYEVDIAGNFTFFNDSLCKILGFSKGELKGMNNREYTDEENAKKVYQTFNRVYTTGEPAKGVGWGIIRKDGTRRFIEASVSINRNAEGDPMGFRGIVRDITERKQAKERLVRLATAVEQAAEIIIVTDINGKIQYVNPAFEQITGYCREEAAGQNFRILKSGEHDQKFYKNLWDTLKKGEVWSGRFTNKKKDGTLYEEEATISPVRDVAGNIINFVTVKRDITQEVMLEAQLHQA